MENSILKHLKYFLRGIILLWPGWLFLLVTVLAIQGGKIYEEIFIVTWLIGVFGSLIYLVGKHGKY